MTIIYIFYEQIVFQYRFFDLFIDLIIRSNASFVKWLRTCESVKHLRELLSLELFTFLKILWA